MLLIVDGGLVLNIIKYVVWSMSSPGSQLLHPSQDCDLHVERRGCRGQICTFYASAVKHGPCANEVLAIEKEMQSHEQVLSFLSVA